MGCTMSSNRNKRSHYPWNHADHQLDDSTKANPFNAHTNSATLLEPIKDDDAAVREVGTNLIADLCRKILESGILQLHFYTMNLEKPTFMILEKLEITTGMNLKNPLPWRQAITFEIITNGSVLHMVVKKKAFVLYSGRIGIRAT